MKIISNQELLANLTHLKKGINNCSLKDIKNIIFFNPVSFYFFVKDFPCHGRQTIDDVLDRIEPYIPLRLTQDNFELFIDSVLETKENEENIIDLMIKVKGDFVYSIQSARSPNQWSEIVDTCESIRQMKDSKPYPSLL
ncbi:MAG: hypothetical protein LBU32_00995 [Clostridiales bacterium]|jgi:hypothetical protein|nr:hypothetical protein [Clostridiales bacterium]